MSGPLGSRASTTRVAESLEGRGRPICKVVSALLSCQGPSGSGVVMLSGDLRSGVTQSSRSGVMSGQLPLEEALKAPRRAGRVCGLPAPRQWCGLGLLLTQGCPMPVGRRRGQGHPQGQAHPTRFHSPETSSRGRGRLVDWGSGQLSPHVVPEVGGVHASPQGSRETESGRARCGPWREGQEERLQSAPSTA